jgi:hypothetical protein
MRRLQRHLTVVVDGLREGYPAVAVTGPRQSGKTTFARMAFPDLPYVNLESPVERPSFQQDPVGFLGRFREGAILDEIQNAPDALSYLPAGTHRRGRPEGTLGRHGLAAARPQPRDVPNPRRAGRHAPSAAVLARGARQGSGPADDVSGGGPARRVSAPLRRGPAPGSRALARGLPLNVRGCSTRWRPRWGRGSGWSSPAATSGSTGGRWQDGGETRRW